MYKNLVEAEPYSLQSLVSLLEQPTRKEPPAVKVIFFGKNLG